MTDDLPFPHPLPPEPTARRWQLYRQEGRPLSDGLKNARSYLTKQGYKRPTAPAPVAAYFHAQARLYHALPPAPPAATRAAFVGDLMWLRDGWDGFLHPAVLAHLNAHPLAFGNLESVVSDRLPVRAFWPDYYTFNSPPALVRAFRRPAGGSTFSALGFANNHTLDYGRAGIEHTLGLLAADGIPQSGVRLADGDPTFVTVAADGIRVGYHAATWGVNPQKGPPPAGVAVNTLPPDAWNPEATGPIDLPNIAAALAGMAAAGAHLRVVALHWGHEFEYFPSTRQVQLARAVVRLGADIIVGTHPHVPQPPEVLAVNGYPLPAAAPAGARLSAPGPARKALVLYSLGNFTTAMFTFACKVGWVPSVGLTRDPATGHIDWHPAGSRFVVNVPRARPARRRMLMLLDDYLAGHAPRPHETAHARFLHAHLGLAGADTFNSRVPGC